MKPSELETPCVVVDLDIVDRNIAAMASLARRHGVQLRPHVKTHKTPELAQAQMAAGAAGITVAKLGEAEVFADAGLDDILVAYQIVGADKVRRLVNLAERVRVTTCIDNLQAAQAISAEAQARGRSVRILLDLDTGLERTGCSPKDALAIATSVAQLPGLRLEGVFSFAGYRPGDPSLQAREAWARQEAETAVAVSRELVERGIPAYTVSVAGTVCTPHAAGVPGVTEVRPGTYIYGDMNYSRLQAVALDACAMRIRATIVGRPTYDRAVIDAGTKCFASDRSVATTEQLYGHLPSRPRSRLTRAWEEHAVIELADEDRALRVGDVVELIPNHACVVSNLADHWYGIRGNELREYAIPARGLVS